MTRYFNNHCVLKQISEYELYRHLLAAAIFFTQFLIPVVIPLCGRIFYGEIERRRTRKGSNFKHYLGGFFIAWSLLGLFVIGKNLHTLATNFSSSSVSDVQKYYHSGIAMAFVLILNAALNVC